MAKKKVTISSLDLTFFRELWRFYASNRTKIRDGKGVFAPGYKQLTKDILDYNDPDLPAPQSLASENGGKRQRLRKPQFEAFEIYVFLKECLRNAPVYKIFESWYHKRGIFKNRHNLLGEDNRPVLDEQLFFNTKAYEELFEKMKKDNFSYANYIFALTMGVGKTRLMALCIFYEFLLANEYPADDLYCHNALVFAPDKTVLRSLLEIKSFDYENVLSKYQANWIKDRMQWHYLDDSTELNILANSEFNLVVSNTQKIWLKRSTKEPNATQKLLQGTKYTDNNDLLSRMYRRLGEEYATPLTEKDLPANQRFSALLRLQQLGVYVDEAHHAFGKKLQDDMKADKALRITINGLAAALDESQSKVVACYNYTGTPYTKNQILPDVVYAYGLKEAIDNGYLKKADLKSYENTQDELFVKDVISNFLSAYKGKRYENMLPKLVFFAPSQEIARDILKPLIEKEISKHGISHRAVLINISDEKTTTNDDIREFNALDSPESEKQFIILVGKGNEGWNCRSLFGVALFRDPSSRIFVLQATMRCLRSISETQQTGHVYLPKESYEILGDELQQNFRLGIDEFKRSGREGKPYTVRVMKRKSLPITHTQRLARLEERNPQEPLKFKPDDWDKEKYKSYREDVNIEHGKLSSPIERTEITQLGETKEWNSYSLPSEIARYLHLSPIRIKQILDESGQINEILAEINQFNQLLYDQVIPAIFHYLYKINEEEHSDTVEVELVNPPESGFYEVHGKEALTDELKTWETQHPSLFDKSFHLDTYCFDSVPEKDFFARVISADEIDEVYFTGMLTAGQSDFFINYIDPDTHGVRSYYPDFLIKTKTGEWLVVEVKAANQIDDPVVQAKKQFAESFLKQSKIKYHMVAHDKVNSINLHSLFS